MIEVTHITKGGLCFRVPVIWDNKELGYFKIYPWTDNNAEFSGYYDVDYVDTSGDKKSICLNNLLREELEQYPNFSIDDANAYMDELKRRCLELSAFL